MASGLNEYLEFLTSHAKNLPAFSPEPYYEPDGDSLIIYLRDEQCYAKRINRLLTVFLSTADHSLVGCEIKGVLRLLRIGGDFGILVYDKKIKVRILLALALAEPPDDPSLESYGYDLKEFEDIEIDREQLVPA